MTAQVLAHEAVLALGRQCHRLTTMSPLYFPPLDSWAVWHLGPLGSVGASLQASPWTPVSATSSPSVL